MQDIDVPQRLSWTETRLYKALAAAFPTYRTRQQKVLDVERLSKALGMTKEGLYKWFRAGRILSTKGVERLVALANSPENREALEKLGEVPPTKDDFARLMLS